MALTPIVVTSGGHSSVTINPVIALISAPVASAAKICEDDHARIGAVRQLGHDHAQNDMTLGGERSISRAADDQMLPIDATARMAKYGSVERIAAGSKSCSVPDTAVNEDSRRDERFAATAIRSGPCPVRAIADGRSFVRHLLAGPLTKHSSPRLLSPEAGEGAAFAVCGLKA
jgi:hypothetical protein